jgi:glycosyltransferase involved in cell wall biosynthesis
VSGPVVLYLVTEPWYFANHRLDHARALIADGFDVHVATRLGDRRDEIRAAGCVVHDIDLARGSTSPARWVREIRAARRIVRAVRPSTVHAVALKPLAIAICLLAMRRRPSLILSVNGLGLSASRRGFGVRVITTVIRLASHARRVTLLFQTHADQLAVVGSTSRGVVIPGVGVDTSRFHPETRRPDPPPWIVAYLGRAVQSKGLSDLVEAFGAEPIDGMELHLYCAIDSSSPGSLDTEHLRSIAQTPGVTVHPATREPEVVLRNAHAAVLPSRAGEGVSKFVLEALASGTPVLLSAESGSAEALTDDTGIVFEIGDPGSIGKALREFAAWSSSQRARSADACRALAVERFALDVIGPQIVDLHRATCGAIP